MVIIKKTPYISDISVNSVIIPQNWGAIPSSVLRTSEDIVPQFLRMMTALTDTSSPELPHSLNVTHNQS